MPACGRCLRNLEPTALANYRYYIEAHILPAFGDRTLASLTAQDVSAWERQIVASGYAPSTARDARTKLVTLLGDAIPQHLQVNPAQRRRGKGHKGRRRIGCTKRPRRHGRLRCKHC